MLELPRSSRSDEAVGISTLVQWARGISATETWKYKASIGLSIDKRGTPGMFASARS
jgi:hypothetical protein